MNKSTLSAAVFKGRTYTSASPQRGKEYTITFQIIFGSGVKVIKPFEHSYRNVAEFLRDWEIKKA